MRSVTSAFLDRLQRVKPVNGGAYHTALCPAHDDHHASLDIKEGEAGLLLICRSHGCSFEAIARAVGSDPQQLFWQPRISMAALVSAPRKPMIRPSPLAIQGTAPGQLIHNADHVYTDPLGTPSARIRRYHRIDPTRPKGYKKSCVAQRWEAETWVNDLNPEEPRYLYNLVNLILNPDERIVFVEGEGLVDRLTHEGILATTTLGGTGGVGHLPDLNILTGREVCILPDDDEPGVKYAETVRMALVKAGANAYIVPALPEMGSQRGIGWDVVDYLDHGGTIPALLEALHPAPPPPLRYALLTVADLLALPPIEWQVPDYIQEGSLYLFYGAPGNGKSFIGMDLGLNLSDTRENPQWCGKLINKPGPVVFVNADGGRGFRDRVAAWHEANQVTPGQCQFVTLNTDLQLYDASCIEEFFRSIDSLDECPASLMIDTYSRCNAGKEENDSAACSLIIHNLDQVINRYGCSIGIYHHTGIEGYRPRGSTVLMGAVDSAFRVTMESGVITMTCTKQRNGADKVEGQSFVLRPIGYRGQVCLWHNGGSDRMTETLRAELIVAAYIEDNPDCVATEIAAHTGIQLRRVSDTIGRLAEQKLIMPGPKRAGRTGAPAITYRRKED